MISRKTATAIPRRKLAIKRKPKDRSTLKKRRSNWIRKSLRESRRKE